MLTNDIECKRVPKFHLLPSLSEEPNFPFTLSSGHGVRRENSWWGAKSGGKVSSCRPMRSSLSRVTRASAHPARRRHEAGARSIAATTLAWVGGLRSYRRQGGEVHRTQVRTDY